jgi:hypothetical protein
LERNNALDAQEETSVVSRLIGKKRSRFWRDEPKGGGSIDVDPERVNNGLLPLLGHPGHLRNLGSGQLTARGDTFAFQTKIL